MLSICCSTIIVMHTYRAAQPALLYLSPACLLAIGGTAAIRGELKAVWNFVDEDADDKAATKGESTGKTDTNGSVVAESAKDK